MADDPRAVPTITLEGTPQGGPLGVLEITALRKEDLELQEADRPQGGVRKIRSAHHRVAAGLAARYTAVEVARHTGYAVSTVYTLKQNPAFKELIEHYRAKADERGFNELQVRSEATAIRLLDEIDERLDGDKAEKIPFATVGDLAIKMLDRAGQSPIKRSENRNLNLTMSGETLDRIRRDAARIRFGPPSEADRDDASSEGGEPGVGGNHG